MYHDLANEADAVPVGHRPYVLDVAAFRCQIEALTRHKLPVATVAQWGTAFRASRAIVLTFDDGHVSNHDLAFPILSEFKMKTTFFITAGFIGKGTTMNWDQIRALHAAGMEIGSHTMTHRPPATLSDDELRYELRTSRDVLENGIGAPVTSLSSPTGFFNPRMRAIAREEGYHALCFGRVGLVTEQSDVFSLNRIAVKPTTSHEEFEALLRFDRSLIRRLKFSESVRDLARQTLGPRFYLPLRQALLSRFSTR
jgi:peptidoglycan/xylan/chitin deacetylase (PgdA/CDA1 family)